MKILPATAMLAVLAGAALAGPALAQQSAHSGGMPSFAATANATPVGSQPLLSWNGQSAHSGVPAFSDDVVAPFDNSQAVALGNAHTGSVVALGSLPAGLYDGTPQQAYAQSVQRYFAAQANGRSSIAQR